MILCFDTETTGKYNFNSTPQDIKQPRVVQLGAVLMDMNFKPSAHLNCIIRPSGWDIPDEAAAIHGITNERAKAEGISCGLVWDLFGEMCFKADVVMGYNLQFDMSMMSVEGCRSRFTWHFKNKYERIDVMKILTPVLKLPGKYDDFKFPKLTEAYEFFFHKPLAGAHGALWDAVATVKVYQAYLKWKEQNEHDNNQMPLV